MPHFNMASIQKTVKGYRVQIKKLGVRDSQIFPTRREAVEWSARRESEISSEKHTPKGERTTLREVLRRYAQDVSPTKRGERKELKEYTLAKCSLAKRSPNASAPRAIPQTKLIGVS